MKLIICSKVALTGLYLLFQFFFYFSFQVFEEEFARFKGHFGPINTLAFHPNGTAVVTGGEDGYIRIQEFDPDYLNFDYEF